LLGLALTAALLLAGCGHAGSSPVRSARGGATTAATGTSTAGPGASREQAATACARAIEKASTIAPSAKPHLVQICETAASPDAATRRKAAREACVELVLASHIPAGPSRERALAICNAP
jgi:methionine synthase II (cobalamin-independent)